MEIRADRYRENAARILRETPGVRTAVTAGPAVRLAFATPPRSAPAGACSAELTVQVVDATSTPRHFALDGVEVEQGLAGVFVAAVAAIEHRHPAGGGKLRH